MQGITPQFGAVFKFTTDARPPIVFYQDLVDEKHSWLGFESYDEGELRGFGFSGPELFNAYKAYYQCFDKRYQTQLVKLLKDYSTDEPVDKSKRQHHFQKFTLAVYEILQPFKGQDGYAAVEQSAGKAFLDKLKGKANDTAKKVRYEKDNQNGKLVDLSG